MKTRNETCCITIVEWHREYNMPKCKNVMIYERWDGYQYHDVINSAMSILMPDAPKITDEQLLVIINKHLFDASIPECNRLALPHNDLDADQCDCTIHEIIGSIEHLKIFAKMFADDVIIKSNGVGGDDDYYDYFPNYVEMFYHVCHELNLKQLYVDTYETIHSNEHRYADDDEQTIPIWAD